MTVSAVALIFSSLASVASTVRGKPAAKAESVAALAVFRKSRRVNGLEAIISSIPIDIITATPRQCESLVFGTRSVTAGGNDIAGKNGLLSRALSSKGGEGEGPAVDFFTAPEGLRFSGF